MPLLSTRGAGSIRSFGFAGASAPLNLAVPSISGTQDVGSSLSSSTGTWSGTPPITFAYQWKRAGSDISGATSSSYTLQSADAGTVITCTVTATNPVASVAATSSGTSQITQAPTLTSSPTISGTTVVGSTLTSTTGSWTGFPASFTYSYQWRRAGSNISGATSSTYTTVSADIGNAITCFVSAFNSAGSNNALSSNSITATAPVGQAQYISGGSYTWVAPAGVTSVNAVVVGGGGGARAGGYYQQAGGGGGLAWANNFSVTPGTGYTVTVGSYVPAGNTGQQSSVFGLSANGGGGGGGPLGSGAGGTLGGPYQGGGNGGPGGQFGGPNGYNSGGGAGGYAGSGGPGGSGNQEAGAPAGGGGGGGYLQGGNVTSGGGGGVGLLGQGSPGGLSGGGSGGGNGGTPGGDAGGDGGNYGGGGGGAYLGPSGGGAVGAVRIIWGPGRAFPSTNTGNL
jgi:hypothetical protein